MNCRLAISRIPREAPGRAASPFAAGTRIGQSDPWKVRMLHGRPTSAHAGHLPEASHASAGRDCPPCPRPDRRVARAKAGVTLLELLLALSIFTLVAGMAAGSFWSITRTWNRANDLLENLHYGEFAMDQLVAALRGAAWFSSKPEAFGFWLDDSGGTSDRAANEISWVTSGTAFLPPDSPLKDGLHRLSVTVEHARGGGQGLAVRAWPHMAEETDGKDVEPWIVVPDVRGFGCEWYDFEEDGWSQDWEETNSLPKVLRVTLTMEPREKDGDPLRLQRIVELEVAPDLPGEEHRDRTTQDKMDREEREAAAGESGGDAKNGSGGSESSGKSNSNSGSGGSGGKSGSGGSSGGSGGSGKSGIGGGASVKTEDGKIVISGGGKGGGR